MITYFIMAITVGISILAMNNDEIKNRFMFNAYAISRHREWWRFFTHGFLHADFGHLIFNMLSLYFFGPAVERVFRDQIFGPGLGEAYFILLYVGGLLVSCIYTYFKQKDNMYYNALGASGAVSSVIYAAVLMFPLSQISLYFIPMPAWFFGAIYLIGSWYMARRNVGNIGHDAHFWGAVYGFLLPIALKPVLFQLFLIQMQTYFTR